MTNQMKPHEFYAHNSPWTELFAPHCQREESRVSSAMSDSAQEVQPTHDALEDVYNREDSADTY